MLLIAHTRHHHKILMICTRDYADLTGCYLDMSADEQTPMEKEQEKDRLDI